MADLLYEEVPSLDLADFTGSDPDKKKKFVAALGEAYNNIGFVAIRNHYLSDGLSAELYDAIKKFFSLQDSVKQKYEIPGLAGQRGYIGKGKEHAKGRNTGDLKEFYHVGQTVIVGLIDEHGVGVGNVQAAFDNRRRHQNVGLMMHKLQHHFLQFAL